MNYNLYLISFFFIIIGFIVYANQIVNTNPLLWFFVPDCPLFILLATISIFLKEIKKDNEYLNTLSIAGLVKYSLWTFYIYISYIGIQFIDLLVIFMHIWMFYLAYLLFSKNIKLKHLLFSLFVLLLNDISDYKLNTFPSSITSFNIQLISIHTFVLTFFVIVLIKIFLLNERLSIFDVLAKKFCGKRRRRI